MKKTVVMMLAFILLFAFTISARPGDDRIIAEKNLKIAELEKQLVDANDKITRLERKIERMERKFGKWMEEAKVKTFNVEIIEAKIDKTGMSRDRREANYAYGVKLLNKESFPVRNFRIKFVFIDRHGEILSDYITEVQEIRRRDAKSVMGTFVIEARMDRRIDKIDAVIVWE